MTAFEQRTLGGSRLRISPQGVGTSMPRLRAAGPRTRDPAAEVELGDGERRALDVLAEGGMLPPLRPTISD